MAGNNLDESHYESDKIISANGYFWRTHKQLRSGDRDPGWSRWSLVWVFLWFLLTFFRTAKNHKKVWWWSMSTANNQERNWFVTALQKISLQNSVRITILGGDVHLAAVGQFYSNPKLSIPTQNDHRYMTNVTLAGVFRVNYRLFLLLSSIHLHRKLSEIYCTLISFIAG